MDKATAEQQGLFEAALKGANCTFKISGKGNLNVIGGDREAVAAAATDAGYFLVHLPTADSNGSVVGYDAKGRDFLGFDRDGFDSKGFDRNGLNRDGLTPSAARAAKKATPPVLSTAPELLRKEDGITITKEGRRFYFATPYGHQLASIVKDAGGSWESASKRWWIKAAGNEDLLTSFDQMLEQTRAHAAQDAERKAAQAEAAAKALIALTWISIPYEATDVRAKAKAQGAKWDPKTKRWGLLPESVASVNAALEEYRTAQEGAKAAERAAAPISLYKFVYQGALVETQWEAGQTIWAADHNAFVTLVTVKRTWVSGRIDNGGEDEPGYRYEARGRLATQDEIDALKAHRQEVQARPASDLPWMTSALMKSPTTRNPTTTTTLSLSSRRSAWLLGLGLFNMSSSA